MEQAHRVCAAVAGELSLAIVRGKAPRPVIESWIKRLRQVADAFEGKLK